jgi:hypothetical protein
MRLASFRALCSRIERASRDKKKKFEKVSELNSAPLSRLQPFPQFCEM